MVRAYCAAEYIVTTIRCIPYAQTQIDRGVYIESPPDRSQRKSLKKIILYYHPIIQRLKKQQG